jgi:hypothetical protein
MVKINDTEGEVTEEEVLKLLEDAAQARLGISAAEMLARYESGELSDPSSVADLIALAGLLKKKPVAA